MLRRHGGVKPPPRVRNRRHLTLREREEISRGIAAGLSCRAIAARLGRHHTSVSREIARHGGLGAYRAVAADTGAWHNARRPKPTRLHRDPVLSALVAAKLERGWSPTQIAHWLRRDSHDPLCRSRSTTPCTPARSARHVKELSCEPGDLYGTRASRNPDNVAAFCGT